MTNKEDELVRIFEKNTINIAVVTETKKKNLASKYVGNCAMFYSGVDEKSRGVKGVVIFIDSKWQRRIIECHENARIIYMKMKYDRGQLVVIGDYAPEEGKKDKTEEFIETSKN